MKSLRSMDERIVCGFGSVSCGWFALVVVSVLGCGSETNPQTKVTQSQPETVQSAQPKSTEKATDTAPKSYKLTGIVRKIDNDSGEVMIRHDEIPGFMKAMTMPFDLRGQEVLKELMPGDEVEGQLIVKPDDIELKDVVITNPAPAAAIKFGPNGVEVASKPLVLLPGEMVPEFKFTLQDGTLAKLSDYRGKTVVLTFIYTRCPLPNFCPLMDRKFGELAARIQNTPRADQIRLLSVSFDPEHDTPEILASHAKVRNAKMPVWTFAVANHEELGKFGPQVGLVYGPGEKEIMHNLSTVVIGPDGSLVRLETGSAGGAWTTDDMMKTLIGAAKIKN